jgi:predicted nucleotidyltransferase
MKDAAPIVNTKVRTLAELREFLRAHADDLRARTIRTRRPPSSCSARGEQAAESDVDLLVSFERLPAIWDFYGIADELELKLGRRVHLVHNDGSPFVRGAFDEMVAP